MRWDAQKLDADEPTALPGLTLAGLQRSVRTPEFAGVTFHEVTCKSALNKVPEASRMPFRWTVNPTRGCLHACTYCFARPTHEYLELDAGRDFETQIIVKTNIVDVLRAELARPSWAREHVALGTNTDPYQRVEGRYRVMPGIIEALAHSGTPLSDPDQGHAAASGPAAARGGRGHRPGRDRRLAGDPATRRCSRPSSRARRRPGPGSTSSARCGRPGCPAG